MYLGVTPSLGFCSPGARVTRHGCWELKSGTRKNIECSQPQISVQPHPLVFIFVSSFLSAVFYIHPIANI